MDLGFFLFAYTGAAELSNAAPKPIKVPLTKSLREMSDDKIDLSSFEFRSSFFFTMFQSSLGRFDSKDYAELLLLRRFLPLIRPTVLLRKIVSDLEPRSF